MVQILRFSFFVILLQTTLAAINVDGGFKHVNSLKSRQKLQRSLLKSEVLTESISKDDQTGGKTIIGNDSAIMNKQVNSNVNKSVKKQLPNMEMGTLDEFLVSTTYRSVGVGKEEGYFVLPQIIDFGDREDIPEVPQNKPNWPFYAPSYEYNKRTAIPQKINDQINQTTTKKPSNDVPNLSYKPMKPFYAPNFPYNLKKPLENKNEKTTAKLPEVTSKAPNLNNENPSMPIEDSFVEPETSSSAPNLNYKPTRPFYFPNYHNPEPTKIPPEGDNQPNDTPEDSTTQKTSNLAPKPPQKVPDLDYKPSRPFYAIGFPYPVTTTTKLPQVQNGGGSIEDTFEETTKKTTAIPDRTSNVPDLNYKPSRPFYASNFPYLVTKWPPVQNGQVEIFEISSTQKSTTFKVPSLGYKPMKPFYAQGWNGYPRPTTKSPNHSFKVLKQNGDKKFIAKQSRVVNSSSLNTDIGQMNNNNLSKTEVTNDNLL